MAGILAAAVPAGTAAAAAVPVVAPPGPRYYAPGSGKTVALTFDDGPGSSTQAIINILLAYHVPATFFDLGQNSAARPALVREEAAYGFLIGNRTWSHPDLAGLPALAQASQVSGKAACCTTPWC